MGAISPAALVDLLQSDDRLDVPATYQDAVAQDRRYFLGFLTHTKSKSVTTQNKIIAGTRRLSAGFKAALRSALEIELRQLRITLAMIALGAFAIILAATVGSIFNFLYLGIAFFGCIWFFMRLGKGKFLRTEWAYLSFILGSIIVFPFMNDNPTLVIIIAGILCAIIPLAILFMDYKRYQDWKTSLIS